MLLVIRIFGVMYNWDKVIFVEYGYCYENNGLFFLVLVGKKL